MAEAGDIHPPGAVGDGAEGVELGSEADAIDMPRAAVAGQRRHSPRGDDDRADCVVAQVGDVDDAVVIVECDALWAIEPRHDADIVDKAGRRRAGGAAARQRRHVARDEGESAHEVVGVVGDVEVGAGTVSGHGQRRGKERR